jgi:hypothetical protein
MLKVKFAVVTKTFENKSKEKGLLTIKKDEIVEVVEKDMDGTWTNVKHNGIVGQIPNSSFQIIDTKDLMKSTSPATDLVLLKLLEQEDSTRVVSICIENHTNYKLINGHYLCVSGTEGAFPLPKEIEKQQNAFFSFKKSDFSVKNLNF